MITACNAMAESSTNKIERSMQITLGEET